MAKQAKTTLSEGVEELKRKIEENNLKNIQEAAKEIDDILIKRGCFIQVTMQWTEGGQPIFYKNIVAKQ